MKKVIEQEYWSDISIEHYDYNDGYVSIFHFELDEIRIEKSKAREVALAICPELGEPTIKTDNTKVILNLESELEKQKELYKGLKELGEFRIGKLEKEIEELNTKISLSAQSRKMLKGIITIKDNQLEEAVEMLKQVLDVNTPTWKSHENINTFLTKHKKH